MLRTRDAPNTPPPTPRAEHTTRGPPRLSAAPDAVGARLAWSGAQARDDAPKVIRGMMSDLKSRIEDLFDLEELVVSVLMKDPSLINDMFIKCGYLELRFIRDSGAVMGGIFGLVQMGLWFFYQPIWLLPVLGLVVGALTNWLALLMIFSPVQPIPICGGRFVLQGLFLKRQEEVSAAYVAAARATADSHAPRTL